MPDEHERAERADDSAGADRAVEDADAGRAGFEQLDRDDDGQHAEGSAREGLHVVSPVTRRRSRSALIARNPSSTARPPNGGRSGGGPAW